jgi:hypothetical protein
VTYQIVGDSVRVTVAQIRNSTTSASGPLEIEVWATPTIPQFGSQLNPTVIATGSIAPLGANSFVNNVDTGFISLSRPVDGSYFITVALEFNSQGTWYYTSLFTFADQYVFGPCSPDAQTLCLNSARFQVRVNWSAPSQGQSGTGTAIPLTDDTGYFWFFNNANIELVVKVLDGRTINGHFWVFYGALSNVQYTITVTDMLTGESKQYTNANGNLASVADSQAFPPSGSQATPTNPPNSTPTPFPTPVPTATPLALNLSGSWSGTISSPSSPLCDANISVVLVQVGTNISGNFNLPGNSSGSFQGTLSGNQLNGALNTVTADGSCAGSGAAYGTASSNSITVYAPSISSANPSCSFCQQNQIVLSR